MLAAGKCEPAKGADMLRGILLGCLALAAVSPSLTRPSYAASPTDAIAFGDAKGLFEPSYSNAKNKNAATIGDFEGRKALRLDLRYEWKGGALDWNRYGKPGEAQRNQYYEKEPNGTMKPDKDYWYAISVFIPADMAPVKTYLQMFDIKYAIDANGTVPAMQFMLYPEGLAFESSIDSKWTCGTYRNAEKRETPACNRTTKEGYFGTQAAMSGRWLDMVAHLRFAKEDGAVDIWFDGKPLYSVKGDTLKGARYTQFKFGPYRLGMKGDPGPVTYYYSHLARASTCAGLEIDGCDGLYATSPAPGVQNLERADTIVFNELEEMKLQGRFVRAYGELKNAESTLKAQYRVETQQNFDDHPGKSTQVSVGFASKVHDKAGRYMLNFNIQGSYAPATDKFYGMQLVVGTPLGTKAPEGLAACGARTEVWDDKNYHLAIQFVPAPEGMVAMNADCVLAALPKSAATQIAFLLDHFSDVAVGLVNTGGDEALTNDNMRAFMGAVARGKVKLLR